MPHYESGTVLTTLKIVTRLILVTNSHFYNKRPDTEDIAYIFLW